MKHLFTLSLSLLAAAGTMAQTTLTPKQEKAAGRYHQLVSRLLTPAAGAAKTTGLSERLVAQSYTQEQTGQASFLRDTSRFSYSGTRGSTFNYEQLVFDT